MKHRCCSSEDANVAKIDFMYFNPDVLKVSCVKRDSLLEFGRNFKEEEVSKNNGPLFQLLILTHSYPFVTNSPVLAHSAHSSLSDPF
jgi:hypothetical protein